MEEPGLFHFADPDDINTPGSSTLAIIFVDITDDNILKAKFSDGSVVPFRIDGGDTISVV